MVKLIIDTEEKYRRNNKRRTKARRNEKGFTKREQEKINKIEQVRKLFDKGLKQNEIAKELGITKGTVSKYLKL